MSFSLVLTVVLVTGSLSPAETLSISQTGLGDDRCPQVQMLIDSQCVDLPKILEKKAPRYPAQGRRALISGTVELTATLQPDGTIGDIRVPKPVPALTKLGFDDEVKKALQKWRYQPVLVDGKPVAVPFEIKAEFKFSDR